MQFGDWAHRNLAVQGYCLTRGEATRLRVGLRFATGLCLPLVAAGLALESPPVLFGLSGIAAVAGFARRHPFDHIWNRGLRHLVDAPEVPENPQRRRHAFKFGAASLSAVAALFAAGQETIALPLGVALLSACALVTATNFCVPSTLLALLEHRFRASRSDPLPMP
jgi:hypothetical protein